MNITQIKDSYTCLDYLGKPLKKTANGWLYRAPWRTDVRPSLSVSADGKGWHDFSSGEHGNLIDLVMRCLNTRDLRRVCAEFPKEWAPLSSFSPPENLLGEQKEEEASAFRSFEVVPLRSKALFAYLYKRKVNLTIAKQFLHEAHYSFRHRDDGRYLYALAYANDQGGYELRSARYKGSTTPKGITTHYYSETAAVVVFEGFMDMLSFATLCGGQRHNYIVLNSVVNAKAAVDVLRDWGAKIYLALDNDDAGTSATMQLLDALPSAIDIRARFLPWKDINEYLKNTH